MGKINKGTKIIFVFEEF